MPHISDNNIDNPLFEQVIIKEVDPLNIIQVKTVIYVKDLCERRNQCRKKLLLMNYSLLRRSLLRMTKLTIE